MSLEVRKLSFSFGAENVLKDISFSVSDGETIALLGENGAGKSTLFRCLLGFLKPSGGEILVNGRPIAEYSHRALSREIAYIPQSYSPTFDYTVRESVLMGTTAQLGIAQQPSKPQLDLADRTLEQLGIAHLAQRGCRQISGGERQLMLLARALVQNAHILIMDEPTANLDYGNSCRVMERVRQLGDTGYTVIFSTHDPQQALRSASRVLALKNGALFVDGAPAAALREEVLSALYGISVAVRSIEVNGEKRTVCVPEG